MIKKLKYIQDFVTGTMMVVVDLSIESRPELIQDVSAFHLAYGELLTFDVEAELTALLSEQLAAEIDREIMTVLFTDHQQPLINLLPPIRKIGGLLMGVTTTIKKHEFISKPKQSFDITQMPTSWTIGRR